MKAIHREKSQLLQKSSLSLDLVALLKQQILDGELNPGDRIIETKVAKELGISQTPVREAIRQLSGEGIVTIVPNKGPMVSSLNDRDVFELYSLRAIIEGFAIRLACQSATQQQVDELVRFFARMEQKLHDDSVTSLLDDSLFIHEYILKLANHSLLLSVYQSISFRISLANRILGVRSTKPKEVDQHRELVEALQQRDPEQAERVMRQHIYRSYQEFMELKRAEEQKKSAQRALDGSWF
ncbi:MAG: GntR family transcriptional regulator [Alicyclobacillus sp.]|nr:GntR family transcriptional regulator [Alicyclobacillus sp.]